MGLLFYLQNLVFYIEWELIYLLGVNIVYTILFDWMSLVFISVVLFISSVVFLYSKSYIRGDLNIDRFIILVFLFVVSMLLIILSPNMISILLGWDGLGLVSYALVVYYQNVKSANAGILTVLSNRLGDVAILVTISWIVNYGRWDFLYLQMMYTSMEIKYILVLVVLAGITKSAQLPFSAWLPAAIAAPTPVSSLVHSSTLVTAGVYLLIRFNELLGVNEYLLLVSTLTLFISGLGANFEFDLKKIIALSTLSQLGVIIIVLSLGMYELAFFHLISHAIFKSLLFLCAGFYIHANRDSQDIRLLGKIMQSYPLVNIYFIGCSLSLCGFPFLAGFYSKDLILECFFFRSINLIVYVLMFVGTLLTISYSVRLLFYVYINKSKKLLITNCVSDTLILIPIGGLFLVSVITGSLFRWVFTPLIILILPVLVKVSFLVVGGSLSFFILKFIQRINLGIHEIRDKISLKLFLGIIWYLPYLSTLPFLTKLSRGKIYLKGMDIGWLEYLGGQGGLTFVIQSSVLTDKWNSINIKLYIYLIGVLFIFMMMLF